MVFTAAQLTAFFENDDQMGMNAEARRRLIIKGITTVESLGVITPEAFDSAIKSLAREGRVADPNRAGMFLPAFEISIPTTLKMTTMINLVRYYETIGRTVTPVNVKWSTVGLQFRDMWVAIEERKTANNPDPPLVTRGLPILKWIGAFRTHLLRAVGAKHYPLAYVIRDNVEPPFPCPVNAPDRPYAADYSSLEDEMIARVPHERGQYQSDNRLVFLDIEKAVLATQYIASIEPYKKKMDGRGAFEALTRQYAGEAVWKAKIKEAEAMLHTRKWKGQTSYSLEKFVSQHRESFMELQECATHLQYQLPNENSRVTYLLDGIDCSDPTLQAVMALLRSDSGPDGKMNDFELAAAYIQPSDPVTKRRAKGANESSGGGGGTKRPQAEISQVEASTPTTRKIRTGKTGVELRFYKQPEYRTLTQPQKDELKSHRESLVANGESGLLPVIGGKPGGKSKKKGKKAGKPIPATTAVTTKATVSALSVILPTATPEPIETTTDPVIPPDIDTILPHAKPASPTPSEQQRIKDAHIAKWLGPYYAENKFRDEMRALEDGMEAVINQANPYQQTILRRDLKIWRDAQDKQTEDWIRANPREDKPDGSLVRQNITKPKEL